MSTAAPTLSLAPQIATQAAGFSHWLRTHRGAVAIAGLLALAAPVTFFTGALSVMRAPTAFNVARLALWWMLYCVALWSALLVLGYYSEQVVRRLEPYARAAVWMVAASAAAIFATVVTAGRTTILVEQGLVYSAATAHLYAFISSMIMGLLYFVHLRRSLGHERAAARLVAAQTAQRHARRSMVQARLQEMQARVDPQLLFEMLDTVRRLYECDAARAERFLDELIVFLRAALPRLRSTSSSLLREVELASAFVRLHELATSSELAMTVDIASDVMHARFPPGVLVPLLDTTVSSGAGNCNMTVSRSNNDCRLALRLGAPPSDTSVARVLTLLRELFGTAAKLEIERTTSATDVLVKVPYELA